MLLCALLGPVLLFFFGQSLEGDQAPGVWGGNDPDRVPRDLAAIPRWNTLARGISISSPESLPGPKGGSQKVVLLNLSMSDSKTSAHPSRTLSSPCIAHTQQASSSSQRNTTLGANVAWERLYPRTSHLRPLGMLPLCPSGCAGWLRPHHVSAATFLHIAYIQPPAWKGFPALRLGIAALPHIVAVLPLVEPKHVTTSLPRSPSRGYVGGAFRGSWSRAWRFRSPVLFRAPLGDGRPRSLCQSPGSCWPFKPTKPR